MQQPEPTGALPSEQPLSTQITQLTQHCKPSSKAAAQRLEWQAQIGSLLAMVGILTAVAWPAASVFVACGGFVAWQWKRSVRLQVERRTGLHAKQKGE